MKQATINLSGHDWQSINSLSGISIGSEMSIQITSGRAIRLCASQSKPASEQKGFRFSAGDWASIKSGSQEVWIKSETDHENSEIEVCG